MALILASTSPYRRALLSRLGLPFEVRAPGLAEHPQAGEAAGTLARRLAAGKARVVAARHPGDWVIGADQVAERDGALLGKPGDRARAFAQLAGNRGKAVRFHTAVCLARSEERDREHLDLTVVRFRSLEEAEIERYLDREPAYDCAGGFKCEGLGISLFEVIESRDPTALVGLPLIALAGLLREAGFAMP